MEAVPYVRDILGRYFRVSVFSFAKKLGSGLCVVILAYFVLLFLLIICIWYHWYQRTLYWFLAMEIGGITHFFQKKKKN